MSSIDYLTAMYDLWEEKSSGKWEKMDTLTEDMIKASDLDDKPGKIAEMKKIISSLPSKMTSATCIWWSLPKWLTDMIKPLTKTKKEWSMPLYKLPGSSDWYMDIPMLLTWKEALTGGTETCLNWWYEKLTGKKPDTDSKMTCILSKYPIDGATTTLKLLGDDDAWTEASYYLDETSDMTIWLCPYLPWLMDGKPDKMWMIIKPA